MTRLKVISHKSFCSHQYTNFDQAGPNYHSKSSLSDVHQRMMMLHRLDQLVATI